MILSIISLTCGHIAALIGSSHYYSVRAGLFIILLSIYNAPGGVYENLQKIWFSRILRRVVSLMLVTSLRYKKF